MPKRIQRKRIKGWRLPANAVIVDRTSRFGNPFRVEDAIEAGYEHPERACVSNFRAWLEGHWSYQDVYVVNGRPFSRVWIREHLGVLAGRDVACTCAADAEWCHGDVYLDLAEVPS